MKATSSKPGKTGEVTSIADDLMKKLGARKPYDLERPAKNLETAKKLKGLFSEHATLTLRDQLEDISHAAHLQEVIAQAPLNGPGEIETRHHLLERAFVDFNLPVKTFDFTIAGGSRVLAPPYDDDWSIGSGMGIFSRTDGRFFAVGTEGESAAGIAFNLSSPEKLSMVITPIGTYQWSWFATRNLPNVRSRGGLAVTVYLNGNNQPVLSRRAVLWSLSGVYGGGSGFSGNQASGRIADAASPAWGLGPVPLAPIHLETGPGLNYQVWVWCWIVETGSSGNPFMSNIGVNLPLVAVDAGPPIKLN